MFVFPFTNTQKPNTYTYSAHRVNRISISFGIHPAPKSFIYVYIIFFSLSPSLFFSRAILPHIVTTNNPLRIFDTQVVVVAATWNLSLVYTYYIFFMYCCYCYWYCCCCCYYLQYIPSMESALLDYNHVQPSLHHTTLYWVVCIRRWNHLQRISRIAYIHIKWGWTHTKVTKIYILYCVCVIVLMASKLYVCVFSFYLLHFLSSKWLFY